MPSFKKNITTILVEAWVLVILFVIIYGRSTYTLFYSLHPQTLEGEALRLSVSYGRFLSVTGIILAVISPFLTLTLSSGKLFLTAGSILCLFLANTGIYSLLPTYYFPGGSFMPWFSGVFVFSPVYLLVAWIGGRLGRIHQFYGLTQGIRPFIIAGTGALSTFIILYLSVLYILSVL